MAFKGGSRACARSAAALGVRAPRGERAPPGNRVRIVAQLVDRARTSTLGRNLRPGTRRHLRHPDRRGAADRRRAQAELTVDERARITQADERPGGLPALPAGAASAGAVHGRRASQAASSTSSRRSRVTRASRWRMRRWRTPTRSSASWGVGGVPPAEAFARAQRAVDERPRARRRPGRGARHRGPAPLHA